MDAAALGRRFSETTRGRIVALLRRGARTVEELAQATASYEATMTARNDRRTTAASTRRGLRLSLAAAADAVQSLDLIVGVVLAGEPTALAAWKRARHVDGVSRGPAPAAEPEPPVEGGVALPKAS